MARFETVTTISALAAVGLANMYLIQDSGAFVAGLGQPSAVAPRQPAAAQARASTATGAESLGATGLLGFGMGFGGLAAAARGLARRSRRRVARRAEDIAVAEKTKAGDVVPYFESLPPTIMKKEQLDLLLSTLPKDQWDNPPEDSALYALKCYAEVYGKGKATKMGWWDYWYMKQTLPTQGEIFDLVAIEEDYQKQREEQRTGSKAAYFPVFIDFIDSGIQTKWRGPEPFAGDQCYAPLPDSGFGKQYVKNLAFYRDGLQPWQRGLEIGMAHGYFIIGPFVSLGPLRNTPEAATVGLLCGCVLIGMISIGGLIFGVTEGKTNGKVKRFDRPGDKEGAGYTEMINWHALGGVGGAGFAHALLTVFGS